jgi:hypothetical protein
MLQPSTLLACVAHSGFYEYNVVSTYSAIRLEKSQCAGESPRYREGERGRVRGANCVSICFAVLQD